MTAVPVRCTAVSVNNRAEHHKEIHDNDDKVVVVYDIVGSVAACFARGVRGIVSALIQGFIKSSRAISAL